MAYASGLPILAPAAQNNLNTVLLRDNTGSQTEATPTASPEFLSSLRTSIATASIPTRTSS